jgi:hypothetical protein
LHHLSKQINGSETDRTEHRSWGSQKNNLGPHFPLKERERAGETEPGKKTREKELGVPNAGGSIATIGLEDLRRGFGQRQQMRYVSVPACLPETDPARLL